MYPGALAKKKRCPEPAGLYPCPVSLPPSHDPQTRNSSFPRAVGRAELEVMGQAQAPSPERGRQAVA